MLSDGIIFIEGSHIIVVRRVTSPSRGVRVARRVCVVHVLFQLPTDVHECLSQLIFALPLALNKGPGIIGAKPYSPDLVVWARFRQNLARTPSGNR